MKYILTLFLVSASVFSQTLVWEMKREIEFINSKISSHWANALGDKYIETCNSDYAELLSTANDIVDLKSSVSYAIMGLQPQIGYFPRLGLIYLRDGNSTTNSIIKDKDHLHLAMAHEWGHHVDKLLNGIKVFEKGEFICDEKVKSELRADCFAGSYMRTLAMGDVNITRVREFLAELGDIEHGEGYQREEAFIKGFLSFDFNICNEI